MKIFSRILDQQSLCSSRHRIDVSELTRHEIIYDGKRTLEVFIQRTKTDAGTQPDAFLLKFPGTGGRAENSTPHPAEFWLDANVEVWTVNPPGYGGSTGRASLHNIDRMVELLHEEIRFRSQGQPLILWSNSLGSLAALRFAVRFPVDAMVVRNPVPLREIVLSRKQWWHPEWIINRVAGAVPQEFDCISNAQQINVPTVFVQCEADTVIPVDFQNLIIEAHAGEKQKFVIPDADHADVPDVEHLPEYKAKLDWLWESATGNGNGGATQV